MSGSHHIVSSCVREYGMEWNYSWGRFDKQQEIPGQKNAKVYQRENSNKKMVLLLRVGQRRGRDNGDCWPWCVLICKVYDGDSKKCRWGAYKSTTLTERPISPTGWSSIFVGLWRAIWLYRQCETWHDMRRRQKGGFYSFNVHFYTDSKLIARRKY